MLCVTRMPQTTLTEPWWDLRWWLKLWSTFWPGLTAAVINLSWPDVWHPAPCWWCLIGDVLSLFTPANKDRFDTFQTRNQHYLNKANKHFWILLYDMSLTWAFGSFKGWKCPASVCIIPSSPSLGENGTVSESQVISPAASSQTIPPVVSSMMVFIAGWLIVSFQLMKGNKNLFILYRFPGFLILPRWQLEHPFICISNKNMHFLYALIKRHSKTTISYQNICLPGQMEAHCHTYFLLNFIQTLSSLPSISKNKSWAKFSDCVHISINDFITLTLGCLIIINQINQFHHCHTDLSILAGCRVARLREGHRGQGKSGHTFLSITGDPAIPIRVMASVESICCSVIFYHGIMKNVHIWSYPKRPRWDQVRPSLIRTPVTSEDAIFCNQQFCNVRSVLHYEISPSSSKSTGQLVVRPPGLSFSFFALFRKLFILVSLACLALK